MEEREIFAEIEYDATPVSVPASKSGQRLSLHAVRATPITPIKADPIRKKFNDMRGIVSGNPYARNDSGFFYRQAQFMEDFTDDYEGNADFYMHYPCYQNMGYEQLRTYFTWRARVRRGEIRPTALSYVFLFMYEMVNNIGVSAPQDGLDKIAAVWNYFRASTKSLDYYLPNWLYDYHIYYTLPRSFDEFTSEHKLREFYKDIFLYDSDGDDCLELWNSVSNYDIMSSKFYNDGNETLMRGCFANVIRALREECVRQGGSIDDLLGYFGDNYAAWYPFRRTLFHNWLRQPDRQVEMPDRRIYYCNNNRWKTNIYMPYTWRKVLAGYLLKKTESCLRDAIKYKFAIKADATVIQYCFKTLRNPCLSFASLNKAIETAVADFRKASNRTIVTVNHQNLARIRAESQDTQTALLVPEDNTASPQKFPSLGGVPPQAAGWSPPQATLPSDPPPTTTPASPQTPQPALPQTPAPTPTPPQTSPPPQTPAPPNTPWQTFHNTLTPTERAALSIILHDNANIKKFAAENDIMLEILADNINEKAIDQIGDSILETADGITIYDDYKQNIAEIVL